jgi:phage terminase large subunit-like protein
MAHQLEPLIKVGKMRVHNRVKEKSHFLSQLEEFPYHKNDDCIDSVSMALSKLPTPQVDISKIPLIQNPIQFAGQRGKITD